eukprot:39394-Amphidinium_carterae.1
MKLARLQQTVNASDLHNPCPRHVVHVVSDRCIHDSTTIMSPMQTYLQRLLPLIYASGALGQGPTFHLD